MLEFLFVGVGGFIGSCARYGLNLLTARINFPMGTLLSNVIAGLFIGFIIGMENQNFAISPRVRLFLTTGLMGGLSTFSTFSLETIQLFQKGQYLLGAGNVALNLFLSLAGVLLGMLAAKLVHTAR